VLGTGLAAPDYRLRVTCVRCGEAFEHSAGSRWSGGSQKTGLNASYVTRARGTSDVQYETDPGRSL
jgi:hypothetical protein